MKKVVLLLLVACHHGPSEDLPAPEPDSPAPVPISGSLTTSAASGSYRLRAVIQTNRRTTGSGPAGIIVLSGTPSAAPVQGAVGQQFNATVALAGYTRAPRGRPGQAAAWWPIGGDSVVVQFTSMNAGEIQLRGAFRGRSIQGEIWFISTATTATFQMGTFSATKGR